jgi:hypothetical protein
MRESLLLLTLLVCGGFAPLAAQQPRVFEGIWPRARLEPLTEPAEAENRFEGHLETDRDSFTPAVKTVDKGRWIVESAYSYIENRRALETHSLPELLIRYGLTERIELRLGWNYEVGQEGNAVSGSGAEIDPTKRGLARESEISYGVKARITDQSGWMPASSAILQASTPTYGKETATTFVATYVFGWEFENKWRTDAALRYGTGIEEGDHHNLWAPSFVVSAPIGERWRVHAEYFGIFSQNKAANTVQQYFSPGVHYLVTRDFEVGIRLGCGLNDQSARFFTNVGVGVRY